MTDLHERPHAPVGRFSQLTDAGANDLLVRATDGAKQNHQKEAQPKKALRLALKRLDYTITTLYWSIRHRSFSRGRWVAAYEGKTWN